MTATKETFDGFFEFRPYQTLCFVLYALNILDELPITKT